MGTWCNLCGDFHEDSEAYVELRGDEVRLLREFLNGERDRHELAAIAKKLGAKL